MGKGYREGGYYTVTLWLRQEAVGVDAQVPPPPPLSTPCLYACMTSQVKLFGSFARWSQDVAPPLDGGPPGRSLLTTAAAAIRYAVSSPAGPVHLNMQVWYRGG